MHVAMVSPKISLDRKKQYQKETFVSETFSISYEKLDKDKNKLKNSITRTVNALLIL